jgi:16S rRNA (cytosine967-C5)-methyltransferase
MSLAPRKTALAILMDIDQSGQTLDRLMDRFHRANELDRRDESFVTAIVYGVLRWRRRLDWIIGKVSTTPLDRMDHLVVNILRMGLYQIIFMDRVPNSAAVNTSVELAKALKKKWLTGFVNGVLRQALRRLSDIALPSSETDPVQALAMTQSMPEWLVKRWINQFGQQEATALCETCNRIPSLALRTHTLKIDRQTLMRQLQPLAKAIRPSIYTPEGIIVDGLKGDLFSSDAFEQGGFQVQDEAAQAVSHLLAPQPGQEVLDACAGLGGKTAHIAALMNNSGRITAMDRVDRKLQQLMQEMRRLGIDIVTPRTIDLETDEFTKNTQSFDRILLDAPCSGLGVIRRNPDAKWSRTPDDIQHCARRQKQLLLNLAPRLKPGGILVYAVCSTEPEETHDVLSLFLSECPQFAIDDRPPDLPPSLSPLMDPHGWLQTRPHRHGTDGFFAVRLRRQETL